MSKSNVLNSQTGFAQKGVGLIEVMVALLVLAIGVLGFVAMQTKAVNSSDDALSRTKAISLIREASERIRSNSLKPAVITEYANKFEETTALAQKTCTNGCSENDIANNDVKFIKEQAKEQDLQVKMLNCPGNTQGLSKKCLVASWNATIPSFGADDNPDDGTMDCMNNGLYHPKSSCIVMEAY